MKTFVLCCVGLCFIQFIVCSTKREHVKEPKRSRALSTYAMTPMLRVGRRSDSSWEPNLEMKREIGKALSLPQISRRAWLEEEQPVYSNNKRTASNPEMWFGPRLGRVQKRNIEEEYAPWTYIILNGQGPVSRQIHFTPRLTREEDFAPDELEAAEQLA